VYVAAELDAMDLPEGLREAFPPLQSGAPNARATVERA
jgi:hypothetical protein